MSKVKKLKKEFSETILNPEGIPMDKKSSGQIRTAHNNWKENVESIKKQKSMNQLSYWQVKSSCAVL